MMMLNVTNRGKEPFASRFDGKNYLFEPIKTVPISMDAARHIFAVGLQDKREVLSRHGWLADSNGYETAMERLNEFAFSVENEDPALEPEVSLTASGDESQEQGSAPLHSDAGASEELPDGGSEQAPADVSEGGSLLDNIPNFGGN